MRKQGSEGGGTILLVDDDYDFRLQHRLYLEGRGYTVWECAGAEEARRILEERRPDAVVADLMMEDDDAGFALCYFIKRRWKNLPVIMVTGVAAETGFDFDAATAEERAWVKADAVLAKPVRLEQLHGMIERLLGERALGSGPAGANE